MRTLILCLWSFWAVAAGPQVALVGELTAPGTFYPNLQKALQAHPQVLALAPSLELTTQELASVSVPTFLADKETYRKIRNPNLIFSKDVASDLALALKVCAPNLFKSAMHLKACLRPHQEKIYPTNTDKVNP